MQKWKLREQLLEQQGLLEEAHHHVKALERAKKELTCTNEELRRTLGTVRLLKKIKPHTEYEINNWKLDINEEGSPCLVVRAFGQRISLVEGDTLTVNLNIG